jgi:phage protein D
MAHDSLVLEIGGEEADDVYPDLLALEVELDEELAGMFRLTLAMRLLADGGWAYLDDDRFAPWTRLVVRAGLDDDRIELISGYITHVRPDFGAVLEQCRLEVWGMDESVLLDREDVLKDWPNTKDSDIAAQTFQAYGLVPQVTDTEVIHDEDVSTIIQRESDFQFLRRLAKRNGYECFVDGGTGWFRPPAVTDTPQPLLAVHFGDETNVNRMGIELNALAPADVAMYAVDRVTKEALDAKAEDGVQAVLGARTAAALAAGGVPPSRVVLSQTAGTSQREMAALCQSLHDRIEWFVRIEGEVSADRYGAVLKPRTTVTVKGVGATHSGVYYVTRVTHVFTPDGYTQRFSAKRNAIRPAGTEDFAGSAAGPLPGIG